MGCFVIKIFMQLVDIVCLEYWVIELVVNVCVCVYCGYMVLQEGVVMVMFMVQVFQDGDGNEGFNGIVRFESVQCLDWDGVIWLGDIIGIEYLDLVMFGLFKVQ